MNDVSGAEKICVCEKRTTARQLLRASPTRLTIAMANISLPFKLQATCFEFWRFLSDLHARSETNKIESKTYDAECVCVCVGWGDELSDHAQAIIVIIIDNFVR